MNSLAVLLVTTLGQFPVCEPVYVAPVYVAPVYTAPVVQELNKPKQAPCSAEVYSSRAKTTDDAEGVACSFTRSVCRTESILFGYASEWNAPSLGVFAGGRQD